jgi:hypothetical protein
VRDKNGRKVISGNLRISDAGSSISVDRGAVITIGSYLTEGISKYQEFVNILEPYQSQRILAHIALLFIEG